MTLIIRITDPLTRFDRGNEMDTSALETKLSELGLVGLQSKTYFQLLRIRPATASLIARSIGVDRTDIYRILRALYNKGLVDIKSGHPNLYEAVTPEIALTKLISEKEEKLIKLKTSAKELLQVLNSITQASLQYPAENLELNSRIYARRRSFISTSESKMWDKGQICDRLMAKSR